MPPKRTAGPWRNDGAWHNDIILLDRILNDFGKERVIMGRYYWDKKNTVEDCKSISISFLKKHGFFCGYRCGGMKWTDRYDEQTGSMGIVVDVMDVPYVKFNYMITDLCSGEKTHYDYKIGLATTACNFGGVRYWFVCPLKVNGLYCGRRILGSSLSQSNPVAAA